MEYLAIAVVIGALLIGVLSVMNPDFLTTLEWLIYLSVVSTLYLLTRRLYLVFRTESQSGRDWRKELAWFLVLYTSIVVGFAGIYYLFRDDFTIKYQAGSDDAFDELLDKKKRFEREIPKVQVEARLEYERWSSLESQIMALYSLISSIKAKRATPEDPRPKWLPSDPTPLYKEIDILREEQKKLNPASIGKYKEYLAAVDRLEDVENQLKRYPYLNFLYFSVVTVATVGYGDIVPKRIRAKMLVLFEILLGGALVLIYLNLVIGLRKDRS